MNFTTNLTNCVNHMSEYTKDTAIAATVGYGLTRAFTVLNPIAGATFFGSCALAGVILDPVFNHKKPESKNQYSGLKYQQPVDLQQYSTKLSTVAGKMAQFAFAWIATPYLTPVVTSTLSAISAEVLSTGALIAGSISLPVSSLPAISLPVIGITALALVIIGAYLKKDKLKEISDDFYYRNLAENQTYWSIANSLSNMKNRLCGNADQ